MHPRTLEQASLTSGAGGRCSTHSRTTRLRVPETERSRGHHRHPGLDRHRACQPPALRDDLHVVRKYRIHLSVCDALNDVIDEPALRRNVASAVPDVLFRERYGFPVPEVVLDEIEWVWETVAMSWGRPALVPDDR